MLHVLFSYKIINCSIIYYKRTIYALFYTINTKALISFRCSISTDNKLSERRTEFGEIKMSLSTLLLLFGTLCLAIAVHLEIVQATALGAQHSNQQQSHHQMKWKYREHHSVLDAANEHSSHVRLMEMTDEELLEELVRVVRQASPNLKGMIKTCA